MNFNRYRISSILALVATIALSAFVGAAEPPLNQIAGRAILLLTFLPMALLFSPAIWVVIKGWDQEHDGRRRQLDAADLFGAAVSLIGWAVTIPYVRVVFFNTEETCAMATGCYAWVLTAQLIMACSACMLLIVIFVTYFLRVKNRARTYAMLIGAAFLSIAAFIWGLASS